VAPLPPDMWLLDEGKDPSLIMTKTEPPSPRAMRVSCESQSKTLSAIQADMERCCVMRRVTTCALVDCTTSGHAYCTDASTEATQLTLPVQRGTGQTLSPAL